MFKLVASITSPLTLIVAASAVWAAPVQTHTPAISPGADVRLVAGGNQVCETKLFGKRARLWLEGDTPVKYQWHHNTMRQTQLSGDTIRIQANPMATISNMVIGQNSNGQKAVTGDFKFKSNRKDDLVFTCSPG